MPNVLTTKEYKAISKPKKERYYQVEYRVNNDEQELINKVCSYTSRNNAWLNLRGFYNIKIKYLGWR